jgi:TPR repeat protein
MADTSANADLDGEYITLSIDELLQRAGAGDDQAQFYLARRLEQGTGVAADPSAAARWYLAALRKNHIGATLNLAAMYVDGRGVGQNRDEAIRLYEPAARLGSPSAKNTIGHLYLGKEGKNPADARKLFLDAADAGFPYAYASLGMMARRGLDTPRHLRTAYAWFSVGARAGDTYAQGNLHALSTEMSPAELSEAKSLAQQFLERYAPLFEKSETKP